MAFTALHSFEAQEARKRNVVQIILLVRSLGVWCGLESGSQR